MDTQKRPLARKNTNAHEWAMLIRMIRVHSWPMVFYWRPSFLRVNGFANAAGGLWPPTADALRYHSIAFACSPSFSYVMPIRHWMKASLVFACLEVGERGLVVARVQRDIAGEVREEDLLLL